MGNQLSTWDLTIKSAVAGPSFDDFDKWNNTRVFSDYTNFYIGIGATAGVAVLLILFNFILGCRYKKYWYSRYTGNKFILPIFVLPPKDQTPLNIWIFILNLIRIKIKSSKCLPSGHSSPWSSPEWWSRSYFFWNFLTRFAVQGWHQIQNKGEDMQINILLIKIRLIFTWWRMAQEQWWISISKILDQLDPSELRILMWVTHQQVKLLLLDTEENLLFEIFLCIL